MNSILLRFNGSRNAEMVRLCKASGFEEKCKSERNSSEETVRILLNTFLLFCSSILVAQVPDGTRQIPLPSSKLLTIPTPGHIGSLNGFPVTAALSPDKHYVAFLNDGYGSQANRAHQS